MKQAREEPADNVYVMETPSVSPTPEIQPTPKPGAIAPPMR